MYSVYRPTNPLTRLLCSGLQRVSTGSAPRTLRRSVAMLFWTSWPTEACRYTARWNSMPRQAACRSMVVPGSCWVLPRKLSENQSAAYWVRQFVYGMSDGLLLLSFFSGGGCRMFCQNCRLARFPWQHLDCIQRNYEGKQNYQTYVKTHYSLWRKSLDIMKYLKMDSFQLYVFPSISPSLCSLRRRPTPWTSCWMKHCEAVSRKWLERPAAFSFTIIDYGNLKSFLCFSMIFHRILWSVRLMIFWVSDCLNKSHQEP